MPLRRGEAADARRHSLIMVGRTTPCRYPLLVWLTDGKECCCAAGSRLVDASLHRRGCGTERAESQFGRDPSAKGVLSAGIDRPSINCTSALHSQGGRYMYLYMSWTIRQVCVGDGSVLFNRQPRIFAALCTAKGPCFKADHVLGTFPYYLIILNSI